MSDALEVTTRLGSSIILRPVARWWLLLELFSPPLSFPKQTKKRFDPFITESLEKQRKASVDSIACDFVSC